ncbi:MAG: nitrous oxide reductase family maturation protein NosD [Bacteroidota bacterium]
MIRSLPLVLLAAWLAPGLASAQATLTVGPEGTVQTLTEALDRAAPGTDIRVQPGVYREPTLEVDTPVSITALGEVVLDGEGERTILRVTADSVTIRGLTFRNVEASFVDDRAALLVEEASECQILENRFENVFFAVYLAEASQCDVIGNVFRGPDVNEARAGNAIHLWYSRHITVRDNDILGHRDGIYFEFVEDSVVENNVSQGNLRYGLHFMFSDRCRYTDNVFRSNGAGVAVMYTAHVEMTGNVFEDNWGAAAFGLLLKEITDSEISGNTFTRNTVGLYAEGSNRMQISENTFERNGWAVKIMADAMQNEFTQNNFVGNSFDVGTNSRQSYSSFTGNYWDAYEGYDLDRDGVGDVPFRPVRLFALIVEQREPAMLLMRSLFVQLLDLAERVAPALTPETLVDTSPAMRPLPI